VKEDFDVDGELGFEPAVSATGSDSAPVGSDSAAAIAESTASPTAASKRPRRTGLRRRLTAVAIMLGALVAMGGSYAAFATSSGAAAGSTATDTAAGKQLYETSCITCHGANLQGVTNRGVSLIGVGSAAVYFQVSTGRMPATGQGAEMLRKPNSFTEQEIEDLEAYVQSVGGGPTLPTGNLTGSDISAGGVLFRLNCASCHGVTGKGAPLSAGKVAPGLNDATANQVYAAMLTGPESMPIFSDNQLTETQKKDIVAYVLNLRASKDPGGNGIDRIGPVSEALVIWVGGVGALMIAILWIGAKSQ
jgi:ubiquinol-cytochrome c reductase cytochrome c subunit